MKRYEMPRKPHIYFRGGFWRVVHMPPIKNQRVGLFTLWAKAHALVIVFNGGQYPAGATTRKERLLGAWKNQIEGYPAVENDVKI